MDRDIVEQQMVSFRQQHDQRGDRPIWIFEHADRTRRDQPEVIIEHRPGHFSNALDMDRIGSADDRLDRGAVARLGPADHGLDHGSGSSIASPS